VLTFDQFIEHAPGPRGSPQLPQGAGDAFGRSEGEDVPTANVESSRSSSTLLHDGHVGVGVVVP
jgi:hypothetical protein